MMSEDAPCGPAALVPRSFTVMSVYRRALLSRVEIMFFWSASMRLKDKLGISLPRVKKDLLDPISNILANCAPWLTPTPSASPIGRRLAELLIPLKRAGPAYRQVVSGVAESCEKRS